MVPADPDPPALDEEDKERDAGSGEREADGKEAPIDGKSCTCMESETAVGGGNEGSGEKKKWTESKVYTRKSFKGLKDNSNLKPPPQSQQTLAFEVVNSSQQPSHGRFNANSDDSSTRNRAQNQIAPAAGAHDTSAGIGSGKLGFPRQENRITISLASRTKQEMREVRRKLEGELSIVRNWVRKIEGQISAGRAATAVGGGGAKRIQSESRPLHQLSISVLENSQTQTDNTEKEKRTPKANQFYRNSEFLLAKDKFPPPDHNKKSKSNTKKSGSNEFGHGFGLGKFSNQIFKNCNTLLERLMKHKHGWVFNEPVNPQALGLNDYFDVIKHPMDLGTVKSRLNKNWYKSPREFAEDVRRTFTNAMTYNPKGQDVHIMADLLLKTFEEKWVSIEADYMRELRLAVDYEVSLPTPTSRKTSETTRFVDPKTKPVSHSGRIAAPKKPKAKDPNKREMTYEEKQKLSTNLQGLPSEKLDNIVQIIRKRNSSLCQNNDEIEVDIDSVDTETLWELDRFVTNYKKGLSKNKRKAEIAIQVEAPEEAEQIQQKIPQPVAELVAVVVEEEETAPKEAKTDEKNKSSSPPAQVEKQGDDTIKSSSSSSSSSDSGSSSGTDSESSSAEGSGAGRSPKS